MTDQELMQWALDALDGYARNCGGGTCDAAEALRNRLEKWTARDMAYRPGGLSQSEPEPEAGVCCQDFDNCRRSCTPRGQWIAHVRCGCGDQIMPDDGAECGNCVAARNAVKPDLAQVGEVGVWGEREWKGLTDWEHEQIAIDCGCASADWVFYGAAVERKLKEKNT